MAEPAGSETGGTELERDVRGLKRDVEAALEAVEFLADLLWRVSSTAGVSLGLKDRRNIEKISEARRVVRSIGHQ